MDQKKNTSSLKCLGKKDKDNQAMYKYDLRLCLGSGSFGKVYEGRVKRKYLRPENGGTDDKVKGQERIKIAVKVLPKKSLRTEREILAIKNEANILKKLHSPNNINCLDVIESNSSIYMVMECADCSLYEYIKLNRQVDIKSLIYQLANGFLELIGAGIVHRDLKPENILILNSVLKISDFGLSRFADIVTDLSSQVGTLPYMSPQVLNPVNKYSYKCDIWSFGVVCYQLEAKILPWRSNYQSPIIFYSQLKQICQRGITFPPNFNPKLKDLVQGCLKFNQKQRLTWAQIYGHPYFEGKFDSISHSKVFTKDTTSLYAINKLRQTITIKNINLEKMLSESIPEFNVEQFHSFLTVIDRAIDYEESCSLFSQIGRDRKTITHSELIEQFQFNHIKANIEYFNKNDVYEGIEMKEIAAKIRAQFQKKQLNFYNLFIKYDKDNSQKLTLTNFVAMLKDVEPSLTDKECEAIFKEFHLDYGEYITYENAFIHLCQILQIPPIYSEELRANFKKIKKQ